jgi:MYXO-CTERM domain-containing protein
MYRVGPGSLPGHHSNRPGRILGLLFFAFITLCWTAPAYSQIAGRTEYTGTESGKIYVEAFTESDATYEKLQTSMINPGEFSFDNPSEGQYTIIAFIDSTDNGRLDPDEIWVEYGQTVSVPPGDQGVVLDLDNPGMPSTEDDTDEDNGCCAVVDSSESTPAVLGLFFLTAAVVVRRRRRS